MGPTPLLQLNPCSCVDLAWFVMHSWIFTLIVGVKAKIIIVMPKKLNGKTLWKHGLSNMLQAIEDLYCNCSVGVLSSVICWFIIKTQQYNFANSCTFETKHDTGTRAEVTDSTVGYIEHIFQHWEKKIRHQQLSMWYWQQNVEDRENTVK
jgi:hypothetical protein